MIYWTLFLTFFKIGLFTIGGGYAMLPLIQQEVVENHTWLSMESFTDFVGIAESTPGPFAINISTFCGMHTAGVLGSLCATGGVVLPSILIILLIVGLCHAALKHPLIKAAIRGAQPVTVGLIGAAGISLILHTIYPSTNSIRWVSLGLAVLLLCGEFKWNIKPLWLIFIGAGLGVLLFGVCGLPQ